MHTISSVAFRNHLQNVILITFDINTGGEAKHKTVYCCAK